MYGLFVADPWLRKGTENLSCVWRWQLSSCKEDLCFPFLGKEKKTIWKQRSSCKERRIGVCKLKKKKKKVILHVRNKEEVLLTKGLSG